MDEDLDMPMQMDDLVADYGELDGFGNFFEESLPQ